MNSKRFGRRRLARAPATEFRVIRFSRRPRWDYLAQRDLTVSTYGLPLVFRRAFFQILQASRDYYRRLFGPSSIGRIEFNVVKSDTASLRLWTNGADRIFLTLRRHQQLYPPTLGGPRHMYGLPHELGHIVLYRSLVNLSQLPAGWGEGWAAYLASFLAVPFLFERFGPDLWPYPYNYLESEGPGYWLRRFSEKPPGRPDPVTRAVQKLHLLDCRLQRFGMAGFFRRVLRKPLRAVEIQRLVDRELTGRA